MTRQEAINILLEHFSEGLVRTIVDALKQEWVGLTDEDIEKILLDPNVAEMHKGNWLVLPYLYAREIEAKLKEKNGYY